MTTKKLVPDLDGDQEYDFSAAGPNPYAERYALGHRLPPPRATAAQVRDDILSVMLADGRELRVPIARFPRLQAGSAAARANLRIIEGGRAIRWPDLDEDIGIAQLLSMGAPAWFDLGR